MKNKSECKCGKGSACCKNKRKSGEHLFADCGGCPKCVTCGCDEDDAFVGGEECSFVIETSKSKTPTVYEKHVIVIDGVEHLVKGMEWTESIGEAIDGGWLKNSPVEIVEHIKQSD